ncbi:MAG TPA: NADH-ubiquinone oxidoreductase-F iron-sulfur binding region domain-containing protein [Acidimicrobiales bacterium]|nr:NADH-ubiquinone oxidoreductase-F iron-sulfur binding region domain-containing protein [Acidimicrobiales bacterium]
MTRTSTPTRPALPCDATALPRLLAGLRPDGAVVGIDEHLARWGPAPLQIAGTDLIDALGASGLTGHGGAWFPVATKWRSIRHGRLRHTVVVGNGAEGEPASVKDALLLTRLPHLVLDGLSLAAVALDAAQVVLYVPASLVRGVAAAIEDRRLRGIDPFAIEVVVAPDRFIAGQESAVVNVLNGRKEAVPTFMGIEPIRERGVNSRPTLVHNVETLADVALIARYGPAWFRGLGTEQSPGTMLTTITGRWPHAQVVEASLGMPLRDVLDLSPDYAHQYHGALLGGYGGGWVTMSALLDLVLSEEAARRANSSLGAGVIALLPRTVCPLAETARVVRYMEHQGAGQCGPCVNGLAGLADMLTALAFQPSAVRGGVTSILDLCQLVDGRGACRHPDGVTRFVRSALAVFSDEVTAHLRGGPCPLVHAPGVLPCPPSDSRVTRVGVRR